MGRKLVSGKFVLSLFFPFAIEMWQKISGELRSSIVV